MSESFDEYRHPHRVNLRAAEAARQSAQSVAKVALVADGDSAAYARAIREADIRFYRAAYKSAVAHGVYATNFWDALKGLGA